MKLNFAFAAMCAAAVLASCSEMKFDPRQPVNESKFGKMVDGVDPEQSFNLATTASVTVTASGPVRIYAPDGKKNVLVAEENVNGTRTINFDAVAGIKDVTVMNMRGGEICNTTLGGSVSFASTKSTYSGDATVKAKLLDTYSNFEYSVVKADVYTDAFYDVDNAASLFYSESGTFTLNPVWYTSESGQAASLGIYYYDENGQKQDVLIFKNDKQDDMLQFYPNWGSGEYSWQTYWDAHMPDLGNRSDLVGNCRSKQIQVTVPAKTAFGFYVIGGNDGSGHFYSESKYNVAPSTGKGENPSHYVADDLGSYDHIASIEIDGRRYLAIDDWCELKPHSYDNPEYYHLVFNLGGDITAGEYPTGEDGEWILAFEDLGDDADYDFNDIVISVSHKANATEADIKLLAAGGTLEDELWYKDTCLGEVHALFGVATTTMVNTMPQSPKLPAVSMKITVPSDFSLSATDMGGFLVKRGGSSSIIAAPEKGNVPYVICVPANWRWPIEMKSIVQAYPSFKLWCNDHTQSLDWYLNCDETKVYKK